MAKLYFNPEALIPNSASISGRNLLYGADAIVETSAAYQADFYEQLYGTKASDGITRVPMYVASGSKTAALLDAAPQWAWMPQHTTLGTFSNIGAFDSSVATLMNGATIAGSVPYDNLQTVVLNGTTQYVDTAWATRTNKMANPIAAVGVAKVGGAGSGTVARVTELPGLPAELPLEVSTGFKVTANGGADGRRWETASLVAGETYSVTGYVYRTGSGTAPIRCRIESPLLALISTPREIKQTEAGAWIKFEGTFVAPESGVHRIKVDQGSGSGPVEFWVTALEVEPGPTIMPKFAGPTIAQVASGAAIHQGTAWESEADIGPFARKSLRTFVWAQNRTNTTTFDTVFGGGNATDGVVFRAQEGGEGNRFYPSTVGGAKEFTTGSPAGVNWMTLTYNDATKAVRLYKNGTAVEAESTTPAGFTAPVGSNLWLGLAPNSGGPAWLGRLASFAVIPRYLTATEVANINSGVGS